MVSMTPLDESLTAEQSFLLCQVNGNTEICGELFENMIKNQLHLLPEDQLWKVLECKYQQLCNQLGVDTLPIFIDEAQVFSDGCRAALLDFSVLTMNGTIRKNSILSLLLNALTSLAVPIIVSGTGFSSNHQELIQSATLLKENPKHQSIIGHPLIWDVNCAIKYLSSVINVTEPLRKVLNSIRFRSFLPCRRRFLGSFLQEILSTVKQDEESSYECCLDYVIVKSVENLASKTVQLVEFVFKL